MEEGEVPVLPHSGAGWALGGSLLYRPCNSQACLWSVEPHRRVCTLQILQQNIFLKTFAVFFFWRGEEGVVFFLLLFLGAFFFFCKLYFCIFNCYFKILTRLVLLITLFLRKKKKSKGGGLHVI